MALPLPTARSVSIYSHLSPSSTGSSSQNYGSRVPPVYDGPLAGKQMEHVTDSLTDCGNSSKSSHHSYLPSPIHPWDEMTMAGGSFKSMYRCRLSLGVCSEPMAPASRISSVSASSCASHIPIKDSTVEQNLRYAVSSWMPSQEQIAWKQLRPQTKGSHWHIYQSKALEKGWGFLSSIP